MTNLPTASLAEADDRLSQACALLGEWHARQTDIGTGRTYVAAGHEAIRAIDAAGRALAACRGALVDELRRDEDQRAVRVDLMLAELRTLRAGREDPETGGPIPAGVDGYTVGGAR